MRKAEYWQKRMLLLEDSSHRDARKCLNSVLKSFDAVQIKINNEIAKWIQRIADNEGISLAEARKRLDARELDEFRWTVEEYIARGEENALNGKWMKQLENASARAHVSRWEALNLSIEEYLQEVYGTENRRVESLLSDVASDRYIHTAFEIMNGIGIAASINVPAVETIIKNPWATDDRIFSSRIWSNMAETKAALQDALLRQFLTGAAPDQAIRTMEQYVDEEIGHARSRAGRLIMTESAAIGNKAQMQCYKDLGVEEYEIIATLDSVTCSHCGGKDGLHYPMDAERIGYTAPPFHANCRCCTAPYFEDERPATRMMRNPKTGNSEYVENMTYEEWAKKYLNGRSLKGNTEKSIITGARITNPDSKEGEAFAKLYYEEIRGFSTDCKRIADNIGADESDIRAIKQYLFFDGTYYDPIEGKEVPFVPDCAIAQSWQRLMLNDHIKPHDRLLIDHELYEMKIKREHPGIDHLVAHRMAEEKYNYQLAEKEFYGNIEKHQKG